MHELNREVDPRDIVTETAFRVDSSLLGRPVAAPWRRGLAVLVDLAAAGAVGELGTGGVVAAVLSTHHATKTHSLAGCRRPDRCAHHL